MIKPRLGLNQKRLISIETLGVWGNNEKKKMTFGQNIERRSQKTSFNLMNNAFTWCTHLFRAS